MTTAEELKLQNEELSRQLKELREQQQHQSITLGSYQKQIADYQSQLAEQAARHSREISEAFETAAQRAEIAAAESAAAVQHAVSNSWRLQSQAMSEQAYELFCADNNAKALELASKAASLDPTNLEAWVIAGATASDLGYQAAADRYFREAVDLLRADAYRDEPRRYMYVFRAMLRNAKHLLPTVWAPVFEEGCRQWTCWNDDSKCLLASAPREILSAGLTSLAQHVAQMQLSRSESIATHAVAYDIADRVGGYASLDSVRAHLNARPASARNSVLERWLLVRDSVTEPTRAAFASALAERYERWKPEIAVEINTRAAEVAKSRYSGHAIAVGTAGLFVSAYPLAVVVSGGAAALLAPVVGVAAGTFYKRSKLAKLTVAAAEELAAKEAAKWEQVLHPAR